MRRIADESTHYGLKWSQPSAMSRDFVLECAHGPVGSLRWRSAFGTLATAETADGSWTFKRIGFWRERATVRSLDSPHDLAVFTNSTWADGGTLVFDGGRSFKATTNFWMSRFLLLDAADVTLVRFDYGGVFRLRAGVEILHAARGLAELPVLVLFGWYLAVMLHDDAAASGGAVAAIG